MADGLDMALDDVIDSEHRGIRASGRGRAKGWGKRFGWPPREEGEKSNERRNSKIEMTLDEVIEEDDVSYQGYKSDKGGKSWDQHFDGGSKGFGIRYSAGYKGNHRSSYSEENPFKGGDFGNVFSKGKARGYGKSRVGGKGRSFSSWNSSWDIASVGKGGVGTHGGEGTASGHRPSWSQHDDQRIDLQKDDDQETDYGRLGALWTETAMSAAWRPRAAGISLGTLATGRHAALASLGRDEGAWQRVQQTPSSPERAIKREQRAAQERPRPRGELPRGHRAPVLKRVRSNSAEARPAREAVRAALIKRRTCKRIRVSNVPSDLDLRDIRDAFEAETGKIAECQQEGRTVYMIFERPEAAKRAIETFDKGELNGKTIAVTFDQ